MTKAMKAKKRNPQDATLRNTRAQKSRITGLQQQLINLALAVTTLQQRVTALENPKPIPPQPDGGA